MSTLEYCWAPCGCASPANSLPLPLLHKLLVLIWLSTCLPFAAQKSSSCDPCMHIAWAGSIVTKTLPFHAHYSCEALLSGHALTITPHSKCAPMIINLPASTPLITQEWPHLWKHCYSHPGVRSLKTSVIIV
jgi:hypothetical protein